MNAAVLWRYLWRVAVGMVLGGIILCSGISRADASTAESSSPGAVTSDPPLTVGLAIGEESIDEKELLTAYLQAVSVVNQRGGVLGRLINPVVSLYKNNGDSVQDAVRRLIDESGVSAVFCGPDNRAAEYIMPIIQDKGVLFFSGGDASCLTGFIEDADNDRTDLQMANRFTFRTNITQRIAARALFDYVLERKSPQSRFFYLELGAAGADQEFSREFVELFYKKMIPLNEIIVEGEESAPVTLLDYVATIRSAAPDVLFLSAATPESLVNFLNVLPALEFDRSFTIVIPPTSTRLIEQVHPSVSAQLLMADYWNSQLSERYRGGRRFNAEYRRQTGESPSCAAATAFTALLAYAAAVEKFQTSDGNRLAAVLGEYSFTVLKTQEQWRSWDHQLLSSLAILEGTSPSERSDPKDVFTVIKEVPIERYAPTRSDNPVQW